MVMFAQLAGLIQYTVRLNVGTNEYTPQPKVVRFFIFKNIYDTNSSSFNYTRER